MFDFYKILCLQKEASFAIDPSDSMILDKHFSDTVGYTDIPLHPGPPKEAWGENNFKEENIRLKSVTELTTSKPNFIPSFLDNYQLSMQNEVPSPSSSPPKSLISNSNHPLNSPLPSASSADQFNPFGSSPPVASSPPLPSTPLPISNSTEHSPAHASTPPPIVPISPSTPTETVDSFVSKNTDSPTVIASTSSVDAPLPEPPPVDKVNQPQSRVDLSIEDIAGIFFIRVCLI